MSIGRLPARTLTLRRELATVTSTFSLEALCAGDVPMRVRQALDGAGQGKPRACSLSRPFVFWLVLSLVLYRTESVAAVLRRLLVALRGRLPSLPIDVLGDDAVAHARRRLGVQPFRRFFEDLGKRATAGPHFHGYRVLAIDGEHLSMPDTPGNVATFGRPNSSRGAAAFPQLLVTGLIAVRTRQLIDATIATAVASERPQAIQLLRSVQPADLLLLDRGFYGLPFFKAAKDRGAEVLCRAPRSAKLTPLPGQSQAKRGGDYLAAISVLAPLEPGELPAPSRTKPRTQKTVTLVVRVIEYRVRGFEPVRLVTTLRDPAITRLQLVELYHERWEFELANDETKVHLSAAPMGTTPTTLRSKTPKNVMQEVYALLSVHALIRHVMADAAKLVNRSPLDLSFVGAVRVLQQAAPTMSLAPAHRLPDLYRDVLRDMAASLVDRPRRARRYPRVVKKKMSNFPRKRPHHGALQAFNPRRIAVPRAS